jgi:glycerophosphoryl diester phosphodiesterase
MKLSLAYPCCLAVLVVLGACAAPGTGKKSNSGQWTIRGNIPPEKFIIQSHRGAGELAPENTLEAFELGWSLGTWPELDVRTTSDGVIVAFHDANFKRTVKDPSPELRNKGVKDVTFDELSRLDVGGWMGEEFKGRRVSRVSEVLERMKGRPERHLYLDIKNVDLEQLAAEVRRAGVGPQVLLASTVYPIIQEWNRLVPNAQTLHWMGGTEESLKKRIKELRAVDFAGITQLQIHVRFNTNSASAEPFNLSREFLRSVGEELRPRGILYQSLPWGASDAKTYWELLDLGVASFATDHPKVTLQAVRDYYYAKPK